MGKFIRWLNGTLLKPFRDRWWNKKTKVRGTVIDPYSYQLGFDAGVESTRPKGGIFVKLSEEELASLESTWKGMMSKPSPSFSIKVLDE